MRCPECKTRNSLAAPKCVECGARFKRKPVPVALILGLSGVLGIFVLVLGAMAVVPPMLSPEAGLQKVAKRVAAGPKTPQDAERLKADLEDAVKHYLERNYQLSSTQMAEKLRTNFPSSAFEINAFDLPRGLKLIDVDTVMQPSNYLVSGKNVVVMRGFEVFDAAKAISDPTGPVLAILGHRTAQAGRQPQLRLYALVGDGVKERPLESVPKFTGEGSAVFAANNRDVDIELSLMSRAVQEGLFTPSSLSSSGVADENLKTKLTFDSGKYTFKDVNGRGPLAALRAVAFTVADPREKGRFSPYLAPGVQAQIDGVGKLQVCPPEFELKRLASRSQPQPERRRRRHRQEAPQPVASGGLRYLMANADDAFEVTLGQANGVYQAVNLVRSKSTRAATATTAVVETGRAVPYEDKTSSLVDRLLDAPEPVLPNADKQKPVGYEAPKSSTVDKETAQSKVVEKQISGESAFIQTSSPTVKMRGGPGTSFGPISELSRGAGVEVIGKDKGWYKIRVQGKEGFVYGGFVNCKTSDAYTTATVNWGRSIKDESNHTIGRTNAGDRVVVVGNNGGEKYKIQLADGRTGYVDKRTLDVGGVSHSSGYGGGSRSSASTSTSSSSANTKPAAPEAPPFVP